MACASRFLAAIGLHSRISLSHCATPFATSPHLTHAGAQTNGARAKKSTRKKSRDAMSAAASSNTISLAYFFIISPQSTSSVMPEIVWL